MHRLRGVFYPPEGEMGVAGGVLEAHGGRANTSRRGLLRPLVSLPKFPGGLRRSTRRGSATMRPAGGGRRARRTAGGPVDSAGRLTTKRPCSPRHVFAGRLSGPFAYLRRARMRGSPPASGPYNIGAVKTGGDRSCGTTSPGGGRSPLARPFAVSGACPRNSAVPGRVHGAAWPPARG